MATQVAVSPRALLVLALLCAVAVALVFWVREPEKAPAGDAAPLLQLDVAAVEALELGHGDMTVRLERAGPDRWKIRSPQEAEADPRVVETLLRSVADARRVRIVEAGKTDRASYGLEPPACVLALFVKDAHSPTMVRLGRQSPVGAERYAAVGDAPIVLADASLGTALEREVLDFVERRLLPVDPERIRRIEIERPGGRLVLERTGTEWSLVEPAADRADAAAADGLARALATLEVARGSSRKIDDAFRLPIRARVRDDGGAVLEAAIGPPETGGPALGARLPSGYGGNVPDRAAGELERPASEFRDRRVASFSNRDVREIVLERAPGHLSVRRDKEGAAWKVVDGRGAPGTADERRVEDFLDRLRWLRGATKDDAGFAAPECLVRVRGEKDDLVRLEIGAKGPAAGAGATSATRLVRSSWRPGVVFALTEEALGPLPATTADLIPPPSPSPAGKLP